MVEELRKLPPSEFTLCGRNAEKNVVFNQDSLVMIPCYGAPFVSDLDHSRQQYTRECNQAYHQRSHNFPPSQLLVPEILPDFALSLQAKT